VSNSNVRAKPIRIDGQSFLFPGGGVAALAAAVSGRPFGVRHAL
jgi:hypothetical protein